MKLSVFLLLFIFAGCNSSVQVPKGIKWEYYNSFENGMHVADEKDETCCPHSALLTNKVARSGKSSLRFEANLSDKDVAHSKRSEMTVFREGADGLGKERWYKFSTYKPKTLNDNVPEIVAQWHDIPDRAEGENFRSPALSLRCVNDQWELSVIWATEMVNTNKSISGRKLFKLGKIKFNKWDDWVFRLKFSYKEDGVVEVYRNGKKVVSYFGPNYYNDHYGPYFKFGIYKWEWKGKSQRTIAVPQTVIYFDDIAVSAKQ